MLKGTFAIKAVAAVVAALGMAGAAQAGFVNGSFESPLGGGAESTTDWTSARSAGCTRSARLAEVIGSAVSSICMSLTARS